MSNLILPTMTRDNLTRVILSKRGGDSQQPVKIAYATHARLTDQVVQVFHHGNLIASLTPDYVWLHNAGWHSQTTANRLRRIAIDNGLSVSVGIKNFRMELRPLDGSPARSFETPYTERMVGVSGNHDMQCGHCKRTWNYRETPTPAGRCPFEYDHNHDEKGN